ncbi:hypothetical protein Tsp_14653, partial [Trichinella spiralis]|uniref:hypothetical protein n=1 Tax=Trichinella spiralis TaxID=6334 RepID=UPI0001EFD46D
NCDSLLLYDVASVTYYIYILLRRKIFKKRVEADDMHEKSDDDGYSAVISTAVVQPDINSLSKAARSEKPNKENAFQRPIDWYNKGYAFSKIINKSREAKNHPISHPLLTVDFSNQSAFIIDNVPNIIANILKNLGHFSSNQQPTSSQL